MNALIPKNSLKMQVFDLKRLSAWCANLSKVVVNDFALDAMLIVEGRSV